MQFYFFLQIRLLSSIWTVDYKKLEHNLTAFIKTTTVVLDDIAPLHPWNIPTVSRHYKSKPWNTIWDHLKLSVHISYRCRRCQQTQQTLRLSRKSKPLSNLPPGLSLQHNSFQQPISSHSHIGLPVAPISPSPQTKPIIAYHLFQRGLRLQFTRATPKHHLLVAFPSLYPPRQNRNTSKCYLHPITLRTKTTIERKTGSKIPTHGLSVPSDYGFVPHVTTVGSCLALLGNVQDAVTGNVRSVLGLRRGGRRVGVEESSKRVAAAAVREDCWRWKQMKSMVLQEDACIGRQIPRELEANPLATNWNAQVNNSEESYHVMLNESHPLSEPQIGEILLPSHLGVQWRFILSSPILLWYLGQISLRLGYVLQEEFASTNLITCGVFYGFSFSTLSCFMVLGIGNMLPLVGTWFLWC